MWLRFSFKSQPCFLLATYGQSPTALCFLFPHLKMEHLGFIMTQTPKFTIYHFLKFYNVLPHLQCYHLTKFLSYCSPKVKTHVFTIAFRVLHDFSLPDYLFRLVSYCSPPFLQVTLSDLLFFLHTRHLTEQRMRWPGCFLYRYLWDLRSHFC